MFNVFELFLGFFETKLTDAATLYSLLTNVLSQFELDLSDCRGQCYDGAANVSGHITGLQKRINDIEPRALYVHCSAHTLNLVVQDAMMTVEKSQLLNAELQRVTLSFQEAQNKIKNVRTSIQEQRNSGFDILWNDSKLKSNELCLEEKDKTRTRKLPKRFNEGSEPHIFSDIREEYKALFYEIIDVTLASLDRRFQQNVIEHLSLIERFIIGEETSHKHIIKFYGSDFDDDKLQLHRDMFLDVAKSRKVPIKNVDDVLKLMKNDDALCQMLPELKKILCI
ncbi:PREDICTED: uncharacterized protein LOC107172455, partial [Diuraphis noxia]|uniref:uncharacterized protein LOC107172455 n=1 Tax=Diuraphis noxia TaxID=143948 RepID=UPI00076397C2